MRVLFLLFFLIVVAIGVTFSILNADPVDLELYFVTLNTVPLSLILVVTLAIGAVLGLIASLSVVLRLKRENSRLRREVKMKEKEVMNLRNIPIKGTH